MWEHSNIPGNKLKLLSVLFMPCREEGHSLGEVIDLRYQGKKINCCYTMGQGRQCLEPEDSLAFSNFSTSLLSDSQWNTVM